MNSGSSLVWKVICFLSYPSTFALILILHNVLVGIVPYISDYRILSSCELKSICGKPVPYPSRPQVFESEGAWAIISGRNYLKVPSSAK